MSYLHWRDVTYATFCQGAYPESAGTGTSWATRCPGTRRGSRSTRCWPDVVRQHLCYLRDGGQVFETYWTSGRAGEAMTPSYGLLDITVYGRQESWEDSPDRLAAAVPDHGDQFRLDGRPTAQWSRLAAGRSDDLTVGSPPAALRCRSGRPSRPCRG